MKLYIDSNVFIYVVLRDPRHEKTCSKLLEAIERGEHEALSSLFALCETHYGIRKRIGSEKATLAIRALLSLPIKFVDMDIGVLAEALHQSEEHNLSIYDAIALATAFGYGAEAIVSYDKDFDKAGLKRIEPRGL